MEINKLFSRIFKNTIFGKYAGSFIELEDVLIKKIIKAENSNDNTIIMILEHYFLFIENNNIRLVGRSVTLIEIKNDYELIAKLKDELLNYILQQKWNSANSI